MIYLDNASTTQVDPRVLQAMIPYLTEEYGNPGTLYGLGRRAEKAVSEARKKVAGFIGAKTEQIIFTSGGTEANNLFVSSLSKRPNNRYIITSEIEHDSLYKAVDEWCKEGYHVINLSPDESGSISPWLLKSVINKYDGQISFVSIMHTNNETGVKNNVEEFGRICHDYGVIFHTDCVQAAGCSELDVNKIRCDSLSISSHKIHGAKGVGALYVRDTKLIKPMIHGGISQEFGLRGGTENVAGIVGFGEACRIAQEYLSEHPEPVEERLKQTIIGTLKELGTLDFHINGEWNSGKTMSIYFKGVDAETLLLMLDSQGVCVSAGSACRSHENKPSRVLMAMGINAEKARNSIRISVSRMNTEEEMVQAAKIIADCVKILRNQH